jgi:hypothetical protein
MLANMNTLFTEPKAFAGILYLFIALTYVSAIIIVRWNLIAVPLRQHLKVAIESVRARLHVEGLGTSPDGETASDHASDTAAYKEVEHLLDEAKKQLDKNIWDMIFWSRGREMNGWRYVHEAGRLMAVLYHPQMVNVRLGGAVSELRQINSREATDLAGVIKAELESDKDDDLKARRALLQGALALIYDNRDNRYAFLDTWDNEAMWMVTSGLLLITVLGCTIGNAALLLVGAVGGFLGRLTHLIKVKVGSTDYGLYWDPLFMSPVLGALTGWTGVLLVVFMANEKLGILGSVFKDVSWTNPLHPYALGLAFLFGLSERFFGNLVSGAQSQMINVNVEESKKPAAEPS